MVMKSKPRVLASGARGGARSGRSRRGFGVQSAQFFLVIPSPGGATDNRPARSAGEKPSSPRVPAERINPGTGERSDRDGATHQNSALL